MTQLDNVVYVVCNSYVIKTYAADTLKSLGEDIHVTGMGVTTDIVVCRDDRQLFVADWDDCISRVSADDHSDQEKWLSTESAKRTFAICKLSLTSQRLLVTSQRSRSLRQYSTTDRKLLCDVHLKGHMKDLYHGVETTRGTFVVCHRGTSDDNKWQHAVSMI